MRVLVTAVCAVALLACGKADSTGDNASRSKALCVKYVELCGAEMAEGCWTDKDFADAERDIGAPAVARYATCVGAARSCEDVAGCMVDLGGDLPKRAPRR